MAVYYKNKSLSELQKLVPPSGNRDYYFSCFHYIHQNPLKAGLVKKLEDWEFSSFRDYTGLRNGILIDKLLASKYCGYNPKWFVKESYEIIISENL